MSSHTPHLIGLGLSGVAIAALATQGYVQAERRGTTIRFRLRFRMAKKQTTRCLGTDLGIARVVQAELIRLQAVHRIRLSVARRGKEIRRLGRRAKQLLTPQVEAAGLKWHGRVLRRPRRPSQSCQ